MGLVQVLRIGLRRIVNSCFYSVAVGAAKCSISPVPLVVTEKTLSTGVTDAGKSNRK